VSKLDLGMIGNGTVCALIGADAAYQWFCLPRFDGTPVFNALLGGTGAFAVELAGRRAASQSYLRNTAVLRTVLESDDGSALEIIDFAPRFERYGRMFLPASVVRAIRPLRGVPRARIRLAPQADWNGPPMPGRRGVSHIAFLGGDSTFRMTTDAPLSYVANGAEFIVHRPMFFIIGPDEPIAQGVRETAEEWEALTVRRWREWTRRLATPAYWQEAVIRAAITLKMCVYEETGGIIAAATTSIPEHHGSSRNWDYRYCWLRDAYFTITALNRLSAMGTLEHYLLYLRNIVAMTAGGHIRPVYGISLTEDLAEEIIPGLPGYRGLGPVRRGNQAAAHIQNDVYGHVVLAATQAFFDERLTAPAGGDEFAALEGVGERAYAVYLTPDAGIWEYRGRASIHTSSAMMCWVACDRLSRIARRVGAPERAAFWRRRADEMRETILKAAWNDKLKAFTGAFGAEDLDASVVLMAAVGFLPAGDPRFVATVERIERDLREGDHIFRYRAEDDFGRPANAFTACTLWQAEALAAIGRRDDAAQMFEAVLAKRNPLGLLSEDIDVATGELWGNFPQTYSMVGVINAAGRLSPSWDEVV
jgi:hypothetical protein